MLYGNRLEMEYSDCSVSGSQESSSQILDLSLKHDVQRLVMGIVSFST